MITIEIVDSIECRVARQHGRFIDPAISFPAEFWREGPFGQKIRVPYRKKVWTTKTQEHNYFPSGLLDRVKEHLTKIKMPFEVKGKFLEIDQDCDYSLPGIKFRPDQIKLMDAVYSFQRGVIQSPTGTGKTLLQLGIISATKNPMLILAHTIGIVSQTYDKMVDFGFKNIQKIQGNSSDQELSGDVVVATMQTFSKLNPNDYCDYFAGVIIDEAHHVSKLDGTYAKILTNLLAPMRIGFTATLPTKLESVYALEGLLGPKIGELTMEEAARKGILAKPRIRLIKAEWKPRLRDQKTYKSVYDLGITNNIARNRQIVNVAEEAIQKGQTVLIMVTKLDHGYNLVDMARKRGLDFKFVQGITDANERDKIKKRLISKQIPCAISTAVWREGIDIPSLDMVINAGGGKSEIQTLQAIGRGLRRTDAKETVTIVDFFDGGHRYLIEHFGQRLTLYFDMGWI